MARFPRAASGSVAFAVDLNQPVPSGRSLTDIAAIQDDASNGPDANPANNAAVRVTSLPAESGKFDFGTAASPLADGYTPVIAATVYSPAQTYGWLPGPNPVAGYDTGIATNSVPDPSVTRDYNYSTGATFAAAVANGLYDVTLTLGDARNFAYVTAIYFGNSSTAADFVPTGGANPAVVTRTYAVGVTSGQLDISIGSSSGYGVIDGLSFSLDATPFTLSSSSPTNNAALTGMISQVSLTFSHAVGAAALSAGYTLIGPGNKAIPITSVTQTSGQTIALNFAAQNASGAYVLALAPSLTDIGGEPLSGPSAITFTDQPLTTGKFDFGTATSPVASGYIQLTTATTFSVAQGYGWLTGTASIGSMDTGITSNTIPDSNVTRDFNCSSAATFAATVPNGLYDVTVTLGDARGFGYSNALYFSNSATPTDIVNTGGTNPAVITRTYTVMVSTGELDLA